MAALDFCRDAGRLRINDEGRTPAFSRSGRAFAGAVEHVGATLAVVTTSFLGAHHAPLDSRTRVLFLKEMTHESFLLPNFNFSPAWSVYSNKIRGKKIDKKSFRMFDYWNVNQYSSTWFDREARDG